MVHRHVHATSAVVKCTKLFAVALGLVAFVSSAALAQGTVCNSSAVIQFPQNDNIHRVIGSNIQMTIALHNGPSTNAGIDDNQTFTTVHFFPSCLSVGGNVCTLDQGENAGPPPP